MQGVFRIHGSMHAAASLILERKISIELSVNGLFPFEGCLFELARYEFDVLRRWQKGEWGQLK